MCIVNIANIVKSYNCTAAKRHEANHLSLSIFLEIKDLQITVSPFSHCICPTCIAEKSHHWIVIHLSSSIQTAVVKSGILVHPWLGDSVLNLSNL